MRIWNGPNWSITWQGPYAGTFHWETFPTGAAIDLAAGLIEPTAEGYIDAPYARGLRAAVAAVAAQLDGVTPTL